MDSYGYGLWALVVVNYVIFIAFGVRGVMRKTLAHIAAEAERAPAHVAALAAH